MRPAVDEAVEVLRRMRQASIAATQARLAAAGPAPGPRQCASCGCVIEPVLADDGWEVAAECGTCRAERERRERHIASLGLTREQRSMTFASFRPATPSQRNALAAVRAGGSAWLHGRPGVGKSHLFTAAAIEAVGERVEMWTALELMAALRTEARSNDSAEPVMHAACSCGLLVVDDIDAPRATDFTLEAWQRIADARYTAGRRTLISSNLDPRQAASRIGARVHSRLVGLCGNAVVHVEGPDGRRMATKGEGRP